MDRAPKWSRRQLLASMVGAGAAARLLPFLPADAVAQTAPKRLLCVFHGMGWLENDFWPRRTSDTAWTLGPSLTALEPVKNKLLFLDGLLMYGSQWFFPDDDNEHASGSAMVFSGSRKQGYATGPSIDGAVASALYAQGVRTPYRSLGLGVNAPPPSPHTSCFFSAAQQPINAQNNPRGVFDTIFANVGTGAPTVDVAAIARQRRQKQSVIDLVRGDLGRVCARIGKAEQDKCEAHLQGVREIEMRLTKDPLPMSSGCTRPAAPAAGADLATTIHQQMDLITSAFSCDLTRVATLQLGNCDGGISQIPGLNFHDVTHAVGDTRGAAGPIADHQRVDRWMADRVAYLLRKLDGVREGNGTLLDNTLVVWASDTTTGQTLTLGPHQHWRFPFLIAGGGNFAFRTGRALKYQMGTKEPANVNECRAWVPHNRLLTSIANAFGMNVNSFGTMDPGTGPLAML